MKDIYELFWKSFWIMLCLFLPIIAQYLYVHGPDFFRVTALTSPDRTTGFNLILAVVTVGLMVGCLYCATEKMPVDCHLFLWNTFWVAFVVAVPLLAQAVFMYGPDFFREMVISGPNDTVVNPGLFFSAAVFMCCGILMLCYKG